ncbi:MAG TPA: hypothetical protein ENI77_06545 [Nitrospirae bacterium]|mgnify:CR=1 FL=1|nr:hypothetical protein [Nitrospirota bacterium]
MENWILIVAGSALAVLITTRLRHDDTPRGLSAPVSFPKTPARFEASNEGFFKIRVIALEFDEIGPVIYINGDFGAGQSRIEVDIVVAELSINGAVDNFVPFDPALDNDQSDVRVGDLINLISPVWIEPGQRGKFRTPMLAPEREERINEIMERLDTAAGRMVDKLDAEFENYSLEGDFLVKIESDFLNDYVIKEISRQIEGELIWRAGRIDAVLRFFNSYEEVIEEIPARFDITIDDAMSLRENIDEIILNALRIEMGLDTVSYNAIVYEY